VQPPRLEVGFRDGPACGTVSRRPFSNESFDIRYSISSFVIQSLSCWQLAAGRRKGRPMNPTIIPLISITLVLAPRLQAQAEFETTRVAPGVYQYRYQGHNAFFVESDKGIVAFDPISTVAAQHYADEIKRVAPEKPLLAIVYSHHHNDHTTGANVLQSAFDVHVPIIAHDRARAPLEAANNADQPPPTLTFSDRLTLHFGDRPIELYYLGENHSDNSIVAVVPDVRVAFAVDFASHDRLGYQDLSSFKFPDQFRSLERLQDLPFDRIVFGHGPMGDKASVDRQVTYYRDLQRAVETAVREGLSEDEAATTIKLPQYADWGGYDTWLELNVRGMYRWVASH